MGIYPWPQLQLLPKEDFKTRYFQKLSDFQFQLLLPAVISGRLLDLRAIVDQTITDIPIHSQIKMSIIKWFQDPLQADVLLTIFLLMLYSNSSIWF